MIQELEWGEGRATTSRLAGRLGVAASSATPRLKNSQTAAAQKPSANRHNNPSPVAVHLMNGRDIRRDNGVSNIAW